MEIKKFSVGISETDFYTIQETVLDDLREKNMSIEWTPLKEDKYIQYDWISSNYSNIKKYCVLFSGGCDSLSLALRHLEKGDNVALCHIPFNIAETFAAYQTYKILKTIYGDKVLGFFKLFDQISVGNGEDVQGYSQQQFTAFYATFIPRELKENCIAVESAYIINDDAISYLKELKQLYNSAIAFKCLPFKIPPYKFPLIKTKHFENIEYIESLEYKYGVTFPCGSSEAPSMRIYKVQKSENTYQMIYFIDYRINDEKENKKNDTLGYIIYDDVIYTHETDNQKEAA